MSGWHLFVRMAPGLMLFLWAAGTWTEPDSLVVQVGFMFLVGLALLASAVEVHEWREWKLRRRR